MDSDHLPALALSSGATQLGEAPGEHYIFSVEELAVFARQVRSPLPDLPPLPAPPLPAPPY